MIQKKRRKKYKKGRKYEQGYLDHLAESVGYHHRGDVRKHIISNRNRAKMARGMLKRYGRAFYPVDNERAINVKWEGRK